MRRVKNITIGDPEKNVVVREQTVADMRSWLADMNALSAGPVDFITHGLFDSVSLTDITKMTNLTMDDLEVMVPSEIQEVVAVCQELNPDFFTLRKRKMLMLQMEAHTSYAAMRQDEQFLLANQTAA